MFVSCIIEENNYYPFGLKHSGYNEGGFEASKYKGKYNGMEYQDELGLNFYDYGARNYDAALGKWMNIDPLAEVSRRWSPYTYGYNNPVRFTDPDGMLAMDQVGLTDRERDILGMNNRSRGDGNTDEGDGKVVSSNEMGSWLRITNREMSYAQDFEDEELPELTIRTYYTYQFTANTNDKGLKAKDWFGIGLGSLGAFYDIKGNALHNDLYWKGKTTGKIYTKNPFFKTKVGWKANSFKATGKMFQGAKSLGSKLGAAGLLVTGYDIVYGKGMTTSNVLDAAFGIAGFIPGVGWMISGSYFLINTGVQLYSGKSIGEHFDE